MRSASIVKRARREDGNEDTRGGHAEGATEGGVHPPSSIEGELEILSIKSSSRSSASPSMSPSSDDETPPFCAIASSSCCCCCSCCCACDCAMLPPLPATRPSAYLCRSSPAAGAPSGQEVRGPRLSSSAVSWATSRRVSAWCGAWAWAMESGTGCLEWSWAEGASWSCRSRVSGDRGDVVSSWKREVEAEQEEQEESEWLSEARDRDGWGNKIEGQEPSHGRQDRDNTDHGARDGRWRKPEGEIIWVGAWTV